MTTLIDKVLIEVPVDAINDYLRHLPSELQQTLPTGQEFMFHVLDSHKKELKTNYGHVFEFVKDNLI